jgi:RimJ/RimL family protein N-acetyltransferase
VEFRPLTEEDVPLLVEATGRETARALWDRTPAGPYSLADARAALAKWTDDTSYGVFENGRLVAAVGLMPDAPGRAELAYWVRPEARGRGLATAALTHLTTVARDNGFTDLWLEIRPDNTASQRVAERAGFVRTDRVSGHGYLVWAGQAASA